MHPETLLLGGRYFNREISVAAAAVKRNDQRPVRFLLERSVRKLTRRFDSVLWEGEEAKIKKAESLLQRLDEALGPYLPEAGPVSDRSSASGLDEIVSLCEKLAGVQNLDTVPVSVIRNLAHWSRISPQGPAKLAIIENVDRLNESATNALLKTLEEPPGGVSFILTTRRKGAVIPTILSRCRTYGFSGRDAEESNTVITRIFRDKTGEHRSIRDYFMSVGGHSLRPLAERFVEGCLGKTEIELALLTEIQQAISAAGAAEGFLAFAEELTEIFREVLHTSPQIPARKLQAWRSLIVEWMHRVEFYRIQPGRALEGIYYGIRDAA
jgi:DNA polymerase-3 subunit gamma/tau